MAGRPSVDQAPPLCRIKVEIQGGDEAYPKGTQRATVFRAKEITPGLEMVNLRPVRFLALTSAQATAYCIAGIGGCDAI